MQSHDKSQEAASQPELIRTLGALSSAGRVLGAQSDSLARRAAYGDLITRRELSQLVLGYFSVVTAGDELVELVIDGAERSGAIA